MFDWLLRGPRREPRSLRLRSRDEPSTATRVDFEELAPDIDTFLGQAAYLQLGFFETLSELIAETPELGEEGGAVAGSGRCPHQA